MGTLFIGICLFLIFSLTLMFGLFFIFRVKEDFDEKIINQQKLLNYHRERMLENNCKADNSKKCNDDCVHFYSGYLEIDHENLIFYTNYPNCDLVKKDIDIHL